MGRKRDELVPRPTKKVEYEIRFATANAQKGWQDLKASIRDPLADTWDFLTRTPLEKTPTNYPLRGQLGTVTRDGRHMNAGSTSPPSKEAPGFGSTSKTASCT